MAKYLSGSPVSDDEFMGGDQFVDGHYKVTIVDACIAHKRICQPNENEAILSFDQLNAALARPYCGYFPELHQKAAALMEGLAGSQTFFTANKRTAIALVQLLIVRSGYRLHPVDNSECIAVATEQLSKDVGARIINLDAVTEWYQRRLRRFAG